VHQVTLYIYIYRTASVTAANMSVLFLKCGTVCLLSCRIVCMLQNQIFSSVMFHLCPASFTENRQYYLWQPKNNALGSKKEIY